MAKGDGWTQLRTVYVIAWCKHSLIKETPFHSIYELRERRCNRTLTDQCQIHVIDLGKLDDLSFPQNSDIARWAKFLAIPDPSRYHEAMEMDPGIKDAIATLDRLSKDPETRRIAQAREDALRMHYEALCASEDKGREEGRQEGRVEGRVELVQAQLAERFGPLNAEFLERLRNATQDRAHQWAIRVLAAKTIDEVFADDE